MANEIKLTELARDNREEIFEAAYNGSYYTIIGCGGDLNEWTNGYRELLDGHGIGTPSEFMAFRGADMNEVYGLTGSNAYKADIAFLMFPLDGLDVPKLAILKLALEDRWFDDIVDNNRRRQEAIDATP